MAYGKACACPKENKECRASCVLHIYRGVKLLIYYPVPFNDFNLMTGFHKIASSSWLGFDVASRFITDIRPLRQAKMLYICTTSWVLYPDGVVIFVKFRKF